MHRALELGPWPVPWVMCIVLGLQDTREPSWAPTILLLYVTADIVTQAQHSQETLGTSKVWWLASIQLVLRPVSIDSLKMSCVPRHDKFPNDYRGVCMACVGNFMPGQRQYKIIWTGVARQRLRGDAGIRKWQKVHMKCVLERESYFSDDKFYFVKCQL